MRNGKQWSIILQTLQVIRECILRLCIKMNKMPEAKFCFCTREIFAYTEYEIKRMVD